MGESGPVRDEPKHPIQVVSRRTGLSADVLRAWEKRYRVVEPGRSEGSHRLYSDTDIRRLVLLRRLTDMGHRIGQLARLSLDELEALVEAEAALPQPPPRRANKEGTAGNAYQHLTSCLAAARSLDAERLANALSRAAVDLATPLLLEEVLTPLLHTLGEEWREGTGRVANEHLATAVVRSFLGNLRLSYFTSGPAPEVIVTTPAGQLHEIGSLMVAVIAEMDGWRATYLGPNLPAEEIAAAAIGKDARAVGLSITYPHDDPRLPLELRKLRRLLPDSCHILIGGTGAHAYSSTLDEIKARRIGDIRDAREQLAAIRRNEG